MFTLDLQEAHQNFCTIDDCEEEVFRKVVEFVYTSNVRDMEVDVALDLIPAADKYLLQELKTLCEEFLSSRTTVENAAHVAAVAQRHSCAQLLEHVCAFFVANKRALVQNADWKELCESEPEFVFKLLEKFCL